MNRTLPCLALLLALLPASSEGRTKNKDLYTLYDVTRNSQAVVVGTVKSVDAPKQVVTLTIDKLWHGQIAPEEGDPGEVRYEVRGSLDAYRTGRRVIEFIDPNLPYGTQDPKTLMAPLKPRSVRNRVVLDLPESKEYGPFVLRYLELSALDRGARWSAELQAHLLKGLESTDARVRMTSGESLADLLNLSDRGGKSPRELLGSEGSATLARVFTKAETPGPGAPLFKLAMTMDDAELAPSMVHGALYLYQSGIDAKDAFKKALDLNAAPAAKAFREEYRTAPTDGPRLQMIAVLGNVGGPHGEAFLAELLVKEKNPYMRGGALQAYVCLPEVGDLWERTMAVYAKEPPAARADLIGRIARCQSREPKLAAFLEKELGSKEKTVRHAAAFEAADLKLPGTEKVLGEVIADCQAASEPGVECLQAMDSLRKLQSPTAVKLLQDALAAPGTSEQFKKDLKSFLEDIGGGGATPAATP